ncbi:hypothetical protein QJS04_geneDACA019949 [Acorus gramineus]|uniref:Uncharacterized protein n=1 Tax=Acorus gramineus TaxID=55184 RepID=A0AAV9AJY6_ACOGR|nr:hypothetical protein QJS04_geneDACA019949 [Acorus gramineus]
MNTQKHHEMHHLPKEIPIFERERERERVSYRCRGGDERGGATGSQGWLMEAFAGVRREGRRAWSRRADRIFFFGGLKTERVDVFSR